MLRHSVSTASSFYCVLVVKQKRVSFLLKAQRYITNNDKCAIFNPNNGAIYTASARLLILQRLSCDSFATT